MSQPTRKRRPPSFPRPFASLAIVYIFGFFFVYAMAMVAPALIEVMIDPVSYPTTPVAGRS